jgi:hypothetical protein
MYLPFRLALALPLAIVALNARLILLAIKAARTSQRRLPRRNDASPPDVSRDSTEWL